MDLTGKKVLSKKYKEAPECSIDVSSLSPGCYYLMVLNRDFRITRKLIIVH